MSACCVSGCKNRYVPASRRGFYTIPSGSKRAHVERRRLWLQAIRRANGGGGGERVKANARVCGDHFISGAASTDPRSPDFVPSVFTCAERRRRSPAERTERVCGRLERRCRRQAAAAAAAAAASVETEESPPRADDAVVLQSPEIMETAEIEMQAPSTPAASKEGKTSTKEDKTDTETIADKRQTMPPQRKTPLKTPAGTPRLDKINPVVLLKPAVSPSGGYQCELCNQTFAIISQLVKHEQQHDEEKSLPRVLSRKLLATQALSRARQDAREDRPSFPCNMCDRVFTTSHNLKRHKLLHVRDGRKCRTCGALFCRRHNRVLIQPRPESKEDASVTEPQESVKVHPETVEPGQTSELADDIKSSWTFIPLLAAATLPVAPPTKSNKVQPPASHSGILSEIPIPALRPSSLTHPPRTRHHYFSNPGTSSQSKSQSCDSPASFRRPRLSEWSELPPALQMFSPKYLTSALLKVKRNYKYIFSKGVDVESRRGDKEDQR